MSVYKSLEERLWQNVLKTDDDSCWNWQGGVCPKGFGYISIDKKRKKVHRVAYKLTYGEVGKSLVVHSCGNKICCNPKHLIMVISKRHKKKTKSRNCGVNNPNAKLSEEQVTEIRKLLCQGKTQKSLAEMYDVSASTINTIATGRYWSENKTS